MGFLLCCNLYCAKNEDGTKILCWKGIYGWGGRLKGNKMKGMISLIATKSSLINKKLGRDDSELSIAHNLLMMLHWRAR